MPSAPPSSKGCGFGLEWGSLNPKVVALEPLFLRVVLRVRYRERYSGRDNDRLDGKVMNH
jgi:hypothetical protein